MQTNDSDDGGCRRAEIIHCYTRAQMLADAELMDVSELASLAGFCVPVAMTQAAWTECVEWVDEAAKAKAPGQSEPGRLWDVLWMARVAATMAGGGHRRRFALQRVPQQGAATRSRRVLLVMQTHAGDRGETVVTIMLPGED